MQNNKESDINSLIQRLKGSGIKLPRSVYPSVDGLLSALDKLASVSEKQKFEDTAGVVCRVLDSATFTCLNNGYKHATACGDQNLARLCHNQLMDFNRRRNRGKSTVPDNRSSVNLPTAGPVKKFHYAESLLNSSDFKPVTNSFVFNDRPAVVNNTPSLDDGPYLTTEPRQWTFATKVLNETFLNPNKPRLELNPLEKVHKTIANAKQSLVRPVIHNQTNLKRMKSDLSIHSFQPINDDNPSGVYRHSNVRIQSEKSNPSKNYFPTLNHQFADKRTNVGINPSGNNQLRSLKIDVPKPIVDKNTRKDESGMSVPKNRNLSRLATQVENKISTISNNSSPVQKKTSQHLSVLKSKNNGRTNDSSRGLTEEKQLVNLRRKSKGTPGILKQNAQKDSNKNDKKNIIFDNISTPVKRFSRLSKIVDSAKIRRGKRKHDSVCSSDLNSTLRPRAKRIRQVILTPCENNGKILSKKTRQCKGTVDSKISCVNSLNYTTDMSSAYNETPKSTMTNRIGKVKVFYKRNLFSTPRDNAKKKWLK